MAGDLRVEPQFEARFEHRKASSDCCGALLRLGGQPGATRHYVCTECEQPCDRVLGEPTEVTAHG